ncbi:competence/damage-inducible protein A [candidate division KSB1 bacterium]|nr:competence/damage-inducible protein A [candidate division KSB1 bacterium]
MKVEIISIGDELLIGQTINTNAGWIGEQLLNIGIQVHWITTIGDNYEYLTNALQLAESRADIVLLTGGLGPTHDDITKKVVCEYFGSKLIMDRNVLEQVRERFRKRGIPMVKINEEQALVPDKAIIIKNNLGTAPGFVFKRNNRYFYVMPGVPREMKGMMNNFILPDISGRLSGNIFIRKTLVTTGIPESTLYERIKDLPAIEKLAKISFLPNLAGVKIRLTAEGKNRQEADTQLAKAEKLVRKNIESFIFAEKDITIEEIIAEWFIKHNKTLAAAESCTGGLVANQFTNIPGSSAFFLGGIISYSNQVKIDTLGVPEELINKHGAVSDKVAGAMAKGVRERLGADYAISTTGIAGPSGATPGKPVGLVYVGYADADETTTARFTFADDRLGNKQRFSQAVMNLLRSKIMEKKF